MKKSVAITALVSTGLLGLSPLAFANSGVPAFLNNAYVEAGFTHSEYSSSYAFPNQPKETTKGDLDVYSLTLGKELGDYDLSLAYDKSKRSKATYTLTGSKKFNQLEVGLKYSLPSKNEGTQMLSDGNELKSEFKSSNVGIFANYDFKTANPAFTPYAGVDFTRVEGKNTTSNTRTGYVSSRESYDYLRYGVKAGVKYDITKNVRVDGNLQYGQANDYYVGTVKNETDGYGISLAARYTFR